MLAGGMWGCHGQVAPSTPSPTVTPTVTATVRPFPQDLIQGTLKNWTQKFQGTSGVVVAALEGGGQVVHNGDRPFEAASLVKLPILIELAQRADLSKELVFEERHRVGGSGVLKDRPAGGSYRIDQLATWMIAESDNVATDMLLEELGLESFGPALQKLGLKATTVERTIFDFGAIDAGRDNRISAADTARMLLGIARREYPGSPWMLEILHQTKRQDLIPAGLPKGLKVAHKTGELTGFLHDAAIVEGQLPYVLVILTQGVDKAVAQPWITGLTRELHGCFEVESKSEGEGEAPP